MILRLTSFLSPRYSSHFAMTAVYIVSDGVSTPERHLFRLRSARLALAGPAARLLAGRFELGFAQRRRLLSLMPI